MNRTDVVSDLLRYLNQHDFAGAGAAEPDHPLHAGGGHVRAHYGGYRLDSLFQPIVELAEGRVLAHEALLAARGHDGAGGGPSPLAIFDAPAEVAGITYLDRLARTLHALNFLVQDAPGSLHLNVHAQHLLAVGGDHGKVFEGILRQCGLAPEQIVLEVNEQAVQDKGGLRRALAAWRDKGYRIALDNVGRDHCQLTRLLALPADILKLDRTLLAGAGQRARQRRLADIIGRILDTGRTLVATGIETAPQRALLQGLGVRLGQGFLLGRPGPEVAVAPRAGQALGG